VTGPVRVGEVLPGVLAEVVDRAGQGYDRWMGLVAQAGYCHHPIRLAGRVEHADRATGEIRQVYDSGAGWGPVEGVRYPPGVQVPVVCGRLPG
jgi:hypothetical protein